MQEKTPLIAVVGATASGKTSLGVQVSRLFFGEVVSADSMQIYTGMSIATAKPTEEEKQGIPHHMIDFISPSDDFSVAAYVECARTVISDIVGRNKIPVLVGGTGLYVNSLIDNIEFTKIVTDAKLREQLNVQAEQIGAEAMLEKLREIDPGIAEKLHPNNLRRIIRALEIYYTTGKTMSEQQKLSKMKPSPYNPCMIGISYRDRQNLYERINQRVDVMLERGLAEEARLNLKSGIGKGASQAIGYKELIPYFNNEISLIEAVQNIKCETRRYAKRQLTWFTRDKRINWIYADENPDILKQAASILESNGFVINGGNRP